MRRNRIRLVMGTICGALTAAAIVHTAVAYRGIAADTATSFPPSTALLLLIPYGLGLTVCAAIWWILARRNRSRRLRSDRKRGIIQEKTGR